MMALLGMAPNVLAPNVLAPNDLAPNGPAPQGQVQRLEPARLPGLGQRVELQVNSTGLWQKVMRFNGNSEAENSFVDRAVAMLVLVDAGAAFRVVDVDKQDVLRTYSRRRGWETA